MVWVARQHGSRGFQKLVAIKTMLPSLSEDPQFERMFLDEAQVASRVRHPNVVEILDLGEQDGVLYIVMEWVEGEPLALVMRRALETGGMPLPIAVRIAAHACLGLHAAHELRDESGEEIGLVHRDVSPQNILVSYSGIVKVVDFGIAKTAGRLAAETTAGQVKGKVPYMSPEQAAGRPIDRRSDVFSVGTVLYMMSTGKHPFRRLEDADTVAQICSPKPVVPPKAVIPDYPSALAEVVMRALAKTPERRYPTARDMALALEALPRESFAAKDHEVAEFVRTLLKERYEKRKASLRAALAAANERAAGRVSTASLGPELTPVSLPLSGFGPVSGSLRPSSPSEPTGPPESGSDEAAAVAHTRTAIRMAPLKLQRTQLLAIAGSLIVALLGLVIGISSRARREPSPAAASSATLVQAPASRELPAPPTERARPAEILDARGAEAALLPSSNAPRTGERAREGTKKPALQALSAQPSASAPRAARDKPFVSPIQNPGF